jgi:hypothetical protein
LIQDTLATLPPETHRDFRSIVDEMIQRKQTYFPNIKRLILDFQFTRTPAGPHLSVMSTPESP